MKDVSQRAEPRISNLLNASLLRRFASTSWRIGASLHAFRRFMHNNQSSFVRFARSLCATLTKVPSLRNTYYLLKDHIGNDLLFIMKCHRLKNWLQSCIKYFPLSGINTTPGAETSAIGFHQKVTLIAHSVKESDFLWNDLKCGGHYLSATEYQRLRSFITETSLGAVLEFGAGFTTALFSKLGCKQVALEGWEGPWLSFARAQGADARLIPFNPDTGFDENGFIAGCEKIFSSVGKKMIFIDSPPGTSNRLSVVKQILKLARDADFYVVHDSIRDSSIVYKLSSALGLIVIDHFPSLRGLTFLGKPGAYINKTSIPQLELKKRMARMRFDVCVTEMPCTRVGKFQKVFINLINKGDEIITASKDGLCFSMHLVDKNDKVICRDAPRYRLPVDLYPNDRVSFWIKKGDFDLKGTQVLFDFVKEGEFWWSEVAQTPCPRVLLSKLR